MAGADRVIVTGASGEVTGSTGVTAITRRRFDSHDTNAGAACSAPLCNPRLAEDDTNVAGDLNLFPSFRDQ